MSDDDLRELERRVAAGGATPDRLRLARALERVGRRDEAVGVLSPCRHDPAARLALAAHSGWTHPAGDAGRTHFADVPPVRRSPRVRWIAPPQTDRVFRWLLASPLGVVCSGATGDALWTQVLDPDTGATIHRVEAGPALVLARETILTTGQSRKALDGHDPLTGARLHEGTKTRTVEPKVLVIGDVLVTATNGLVAGHAFPDPRRKPALLWEKRFSPPGKAGVISSVAAAGDLVLVSTHNTVHALDPRTGAERFRVPGRAVMADAHGFLSDERRGRLVLRDPRGREIWGREAALPHALSPTVVVADSPGPLLLLDRADGRVIGELSLTVDAVAIARDVVYVSTSEDAGGGGSDEPIGPFLPAIAAFSLAAERLWTFRLPDPIEIEPDCLVPMARRVCAPMPYGGVFCIDEG